MFAEKIVSKFEVLHLYFYFVFLIRFRSFDRPGYVNQNAIFSSNTGSAGM